MSGKATNELANIKAELQQIINELSVCESNVRSGSIGVSASRCADSINETKNYIADIKQRVSSLSAIAAAKDEAAANGGNGTFGSGGGGGGGSR